MTMNKLSRPVVAVTTRGVCGRPTAGPRSSPGVRSVLRVLALIAATLSTLLALTVAPASASAVRDPIHPDTVASATLTDARISFITNDEDKDADSFVGITVLGHGRVGASLAGTFGHFDDGSFHGPFHMVLNNVTAADLSSGLVQFSFSPVGNDTWRFSYSLTLTFSDGTAFAFNENSKSLSQDNSFFQTPFTLVNQVLVPNVIGETLPQATRDLTAVGLVRGPVKNKVDCANVGLVTDASPGAGTPVNPGTEITLTLGTEPPRGMSCP